MQAFTFGKSLRSCMTISHVHAYPQQHKTRTIQCEMRLDILCTLLRGTLYTRVTLYISEKSLKNTKQNLFSQYTLRDIQINDPRSSAAHNIHTSQSEPRLSYIRSSAAVRRNPAISPRLSNPTSDTSSWALVVMVCLMAPHCMPTGPLSASVSLKMRLLAPG